MRASNFRERRKTLEKEHQEALAKLDEIGWKLEWEPRYQKFSGFLGGKKKAKILDLGSGVTSSFLRLLKQEGYENLLGLELTEAASQEAKRHGIKVLVGDLEKDNLAKLLKGDKFDYVILGETIEHLFFPEKVLRKMKKILNPGGRLILSTPNASYWTNSVLLALFPQYLKYFSTSYGPKDHRHHFTPMSLRKLLRKSGFEIEEFVGIPHWLRRPVKKGFKINLVVFIENMIYRLTNQLMRVNLSLFAQYLIVKTRLK